LKLDLLQKYFFATDLRRFSLILKNPCEFVKSVAKKQNRTASRLAQEFIEIISK